MTRRPDIQSAWNDDPAIAYQVVGDGPRDLPILSGCRSNLEYLSHWERSAAYLQRLATTPRLISSTGGERGPDRFRLALAPRSGRRFDEAGDHESKGVSEHRRLHRVVGPHAA